MKKDYTRFFGKEWAEFLDPFLQSKEYEKIGATLINQATQGVPITPGFKNIFKAFKECPWHILHTIIIGQDAYSTMTEDGDFVGDGIAFSSNTSKAAPPFLESIFEAIDTDIYQGDYTPVFTWSNQLKHTVCDLSPWAHQGILLLNCSLTTIVGKPGEHLDIWRPFIQYVIKQVTDRRDSLGIVLLGSEANALRPIITNDTHFVGICEHPAAAQFYNRSWKHNSVLGALDKFHKNKNNITIKW